MQPQPVTDVQQEVDQLSQVLFPELGDRSKRANVHIQRRLHYADGLERYEQEFQLEGSPENAGEPGRRKRLIAYFIIFISKITFNIYFYLP